MHPKNDQHLWNFAFSLLYASFLGLAIYDIYGMTGGFVFRFSYLDLLIIPLAVFRIIRLFRKRREVKGSDGVAYVEYVPYSHGPMRTMSELLDCPWCTGVWASLAVVYLYLIAPWFWLALFILAVSSVASLLQIVSNAVGWKAEELKTRNKPE